MAAQQSALRADDIDDIIAARQVALADKLRGQMPVTFVIDHLVIKGLPNAIIHRIIHRQYPTARTTLNSIAGRRKSMRKRNPDILTSTAAHVQWRAGIAEAAAAPSAGKGRGKGKTRGGGKSNGGRQGK